jgi:FAS-associated factor 2
MAVIAKCAGVTPAADFLNALKRTVEEHGRLLEPIRADRASRQADRTIRQEQETAYERSLKQDQERSRRKREEQAAKEARERDERDKAEALAKRERLVKQWKQHRVSTFPSEPPAEAKNTSRISVRLPSGERIVRRFTPETSMVVLYALVECHEELKGPAQAEIPPPAGYVHEFAFQLVSPIPRKVFTCEGTVGECIGRSGNLMVESLEDEDEDED